MDALPTEGLPPGWAVAPLGDLIDGIEAGKNVAAIGRPPESGETGIVKVSAVTWDEFDEDASKTLFPGTEIDPAHLIQPGDFLISRANTIELVGAPVIVKRFRRRLVLSDKVLRLRVAAGFDRWLELFLKSHSGRAQIEQYATGAQLSMRNISQENLRRIAVPVAPKDEQARIVSAVNALFEEVEAGEAALVRAREGLTQFGASLLHAACTGALTADWRAANRTNETGDDVIRASLHRAGAVAQSKALKIELSATPDSLPDLPPSWRWARLWQLCHVTGGITVDAKRSGDDLIEVPYLRVANVQRGRLDLGTVKSLKASPDQIARLLLRPNDVLLNEGGDRDKLGRGWIWDGQIEPCIHQNHVFRARPYLPELNGRFISHYLNELGRSYFFSNATQTVNLASISLRAVLGTPIPVPPLGEIAEIVKRTAELETTVSVPMVPEDSGSQLRQSILHAAFTGRLVPQDPADEPAAALLARLRATPAAARRPRARRTATQPDLIETPA